MITLHVNAKGSEALSRFPSHCLEFYTQDNDMSTSWTCDYNPNRNGDCKLVFNLFWYRHIKQVKIGELIQCSWPQFSTAIKQSRYAMLNASFSALNVLMTLNHALMTGMQQILPGILVLISPQLRDRANIRSSLIFVHLVERQYRCLFAP